MKKITVRSFRRSRTQSPKRDCMTHGGSDTPVSVSSTNRRVSGSEFYRGSGEISPYSESGSPTSFNDDEGRQKRGDKKGFFKKLRRRLTNSAKKSSFTSDRIDDSFSRSRSRDKNKSRDARKLCGAVGGISSEKSSKSTSSCQSIEAALESLTTTGKTEPIANSEHSSENGINIIGTKPRSKSNSVETSPVKTNSDTLASDRSILVLNDDDYSYNTTHIGTGISSITNDNIINNDLALMKANMDAHSESRGSTSTMQSDNYRIGGAGPVYNQLKDQPKICNLTQELFRLSRFGWYWGPITRVEAESKLSDQLDGAFLVRDSSDERYLLSLSFRSHGRILHTRIEHCNGLFSFYAQPDTEGYPSIVELIEHSMHDSQSGVFCYSRSRCPGAPSFPVRLTKPVSRFTHVRSLQYLCRFIIRQYIRLDHIQQLPLPTQIKGWIEETQY